MEKKKVVVRLVKYIRGSEFDRWHWCKNCTQYPMYIYQETSIEPPSNLCDQCKTKECDGNCQYVELYESSKMVTVK